MTHASNTFVSSESAKLHALCAFTPTCLTHHWYAPYAPASLCPLPIINMYLTRLAHLTRLRAYEPTHLYPHQLAPYPPLSCLVRNTVVSVGPRAKKFNIGRNDHGHRQRCEFSVLDRKHPFWANLAQKIKIVSLS